MSTYPSQYEAEALVELLDAVDGVFTGYCTGTAPDALKAEFLSTIDAHMERVFRSPDTSPWEVIIMKSKRKGGGFNRHVAWRLGWAQKEVQRVV